MSSRVVAVPEQRYAEELADLEGIEFVVWDWSGSHPRQDEFEFVVPPYMGTYPYAERLGGLQALEAVQLLTAGYEYLKGAVPEGVTVCNAAGVHDASTAELAVGLAIASQRSLPAHAIAQTRGEWARSALNNALADSRVLVVGYGQIGRAIVQRLLPFEVQVTAVASRARDGDELVDTVHGIDELPELATGSDIMILIVPLTESTAGLVDAELLAQLPDNALVINVARGAVVDTEALVAECSAGRLRAALDVTDPEPLPSDHPLWSTPGVFITPHVGGATKAMFPRAVRLLRSQLIAWRDGAELANVVA